MAYGLLALTPTEFRALTVTEFHAMVEARVQYHDARDKHWRHFFAAMTANMMNAGGRMEQAVQATDLLGLDAQDDALRDQARRLAQVKKKP